MTDRHDDPELMTGSHALNALTDDERASVERALSDSPELQRESDSLRETALALAFAVSPIEPSASLRTSLLAKIQTTPQLPALDDSRVTPEPVREARNASAPDVTPATPVTDLQSAPGRAASTARARWFQRPAAMLSMAAAGAVVLLSVGFGVGGTLLQDDGGAPATTQAASGLDQIYAAPDFQRSTAKVKGGGTATVVWSGQLQRSAVILDGVSAAPKDKTYEALVHRFAGVRRHDHGSRPDGRRRRWRPLGRPPRHHGHRRHDRHHGRAGRGSKQPTTKPVVAVPTSEA